VVPLDPMAERHPAGPEPMIGRVEVDGEQPLLRQPDGPVDQVSQVREGEAAIGGQLHFSFNGIVEHTEDYPVREGPNLGGGGSVSATHRVKRRHRRLTSSRKVQLPVRCGSSGSGHTRS